jgi:hypothetical protein
LLEKGCCYNCNKNSFNNNNKNKNNNDDDDVVVVVCGIEAIKLS